MCDRPVHLLPVFATALLLTGAGGRCGEPETAPPAPPVEDAAPPAPEAPPSPAPDPRIAFTPSNPAAGAEIRVRAGPITFRNGCEGIESVEVHRDGSRIEVRWKRRAVPPDAMCTMALHDDPIEAVLTGLEAGTYTVVVPEVGETTLSVGP